jgi:hypothetical protein
MFLALPNIGVDERSMLVHSDTNSGMEQHILEDELILVRYY